MEAIDKAIQGVYYKDKDKPLVAARSIRVLLVITGLATGGATNVVLDIARHFKDRPEFDLHLVTGPIPPGRTDVTHLAYKMGIPTQVVPSLINRIDPITNWKAVAALRRIMIEGKYDVVHTHSSVAGIVGRFAALAAGIPVILHHVHGWALHDGMSSLTRTLYLTLERLCAKFTDRIIAVSDADIRTGLSQRIARVDKFRLVYNGIDLEKFRHDVSDKQIRAELGLDPHCKLVGMIGRLDEQKNPLDLIRAAAIVVKRYPKVQFVIVGDGPLRPACEQLISELNLKDKFFLLGFRNDVARILPILTIVAMSSLWEGLPLAFLEAMSAGKPIVANDIDGARDVVRNGETGFLVPPHQPQPMAEFILTLLNNASLRKKMGRVAQGYSDHYSLQNMVENIESLYKELGSVGQGSLAPLRKLLAWLAGRRFETASVSSHGTSSSRLERIAEAFVRFQAPFSERRLLLGIGDALSVAAAQILTLGLLIKSGAWGINTASNEIYTWYSFIPILAVWFSLAWFNDLYHVPSSYVKTRTLRRIIQTTLLSVLIFAGIDYAVPGGVPLYYYLPLTIMLILAVGSWRLFYTVVFKRNAFRQRVLLIGNGSQSKQILRDIQKRGSSSYETYKVAGYVHETKPKNKSDELLYLGQPRDLLSVIQKHKIHEIVVTADGRLKNEVFDSLVECQSKGVRVSWMAEFYERLYQRVPVEHMNRRWALYMMQNRPVFNRTELAIKRLSDLVMLLMALPILLFVLLPIALAVKLESPGPVFYRQKRCGRGGEIFTVLVHMAGFIYLIPDGWSRAHAKRNLRIIYISMWRLCECVIPVVRSA